MVAAIGMRTVYTWTEVCEFLGMGLAQVQWRVRCNQLVKRYEGQYPFDQQDVNQFITHLNAGKFAVARRSNSRASGSGRIGARAGIRKVQDE